MKKLSEQQISEIKKLHRGGLNQTQLSSNFGVSRTTIRNYIKGYYVYQTRKEKLAFLTQKEWTAIAKDKLNKISKRLDAPVYHDCMRDL
jgi:transposase